MTDVLISASQPTHHFLWVFKCSKEFSSALRKFFFFLRNHPPQKKKSHGTIPALLVPKTSPPLVHLSVPRLPRIPELGEEPPKPPSPTFDPSPDQNAECHPAPGGAEGPSLAGSNQLSMKDDPGVFPAWRSSRSSIPSVPRVASPHPRCARSCRAQVWLKGALFFFPPHTFSGLCPRFVAFRVVVSRRGRGPSTGLEAQSCQVCERNEIFQRFLIKMSCLLTRRTRSGGLFNLPGLGLVSDTKRRPKQGPKNPWGELGSSRGATTTQGAAALGF